MVTLFQTVVLVSGHSLGGVRCNIPLSLQPNISLTDASPYRYIASQPHTLNGHKNDDEDDIEKKEGQLWKKRDGLVCGRQKGMALLVIGKMESGWMVVIWA